MVVAVTLRGSVAHPAVAGHGALGVGRPSQTDRYLPERTVTVDDHGQVVLAEDGREGREVATIAH